MDKGWRTWKGLTEEKLLAELEINAQKRERIRRETVMKKKKSEVRYDVSGPEVMIDFCRMRDFFFFFFFPRQLQ